MALMQTGEIPLVILGQFGFALLIGSYGAVNPIAICEIFPRDVRCSAVSTAYNITVGVAGGTAPAVATWLIGVTDHAKVPALYIMAGAAISAVAALSVHESARQAIADSVLPELAAARIPGAEETRASAAFTPVRRRAEARLVPRAAPPRGAHHFLLDRAEGRGAVGRDGLDPHPVADLQERAARRAELDRLERPPLGDAGEAGAGPCSRRCPRR